MKRSDDSVRRKEYTYSKRRRIKVGFAVETSPPSENNITVESFSSPFHYYSTIFCGFVHL